MCLCGSRRRRRGDYGITRQTPQGPRFRVVWIAVVPVIFLFVLARHGLVLIDGWALFDSLPGKVNEKDFPFRLSNSKPTDGSVSQCSRSTVASKKRPYV